MIDRRSLLQAAAAGTAGLAASGFAGGALAQAGLRYGPEAAFSWESLKARAKVLAGQPYAAPQPSKPDVLWRIDYDAHGRIRYKTDLAVFADGPGRFPVTFFHLGRYFQKPVRMHVAAAGQAKEILYDPAYFDMPKDSPAHELTAGTGFAGFRFQEARDGKLDWRKNDWVAFLGASYFRAIGELYQYGLSARGVDGQHRRLQRRAGGVSCLHPCLVRDAGRGQRFAVTVYALLDGPSLAGAYRFVMRRNKAVIIEVEKFADPAAAR